MTINKLSVKKLVEFRRFSERKRSTFAAKLKVPIISNLDDDGGGGDYWIRSTSVLGRAFKYNDNTIVKEKLDTLASDYESTENKNTKIMYQRNLEILHNYEDFDFSIWRPSTELKFLSKPKTPLLIKNIPIQIIPHHVFSYEDKNEFKVGGIWFVVWLDGFKLDDLGIFSEALFRYISFFYSRDYNVDPNYCLIVDALGKEIVGYNQILKGEIPSLLQNTIVALDKYLH